jgi:hypothetical protein
MPKYFPLVRTKVKTVTVTVGDTGAVNSETLRYDLPEVAPVEVDSVNTEVTISESTGAPIEQSVLAILLPASEAEPVQVEDVTGTEVFLGTNEPQPPQEDSIAAVIQALTDESLAPTDVIGIETTISESDLSAVEDVTGTVASFVVQDSESTATDEISIKAGVKENSLAGTDPSRLEVDVSFLWPNLLVSGTGFTETENMLDKSNATFASCSSSSSGAVGSGGTEETTVCDFEVSVLDPELDDLTIDFVEISWEVSAATTGVQTSAGQCIIDYQYSINNSTWVTFFAQTAQTASTSSLVITGDIGGDWQLIKDIKFRAVGEVRSGTGVLSVTTSALWNYAKIRILASKDY